MTRTAPARVRSEAKLGLELHKKWKRGGTSVGVARAVQLASGKTVSDQTIKRMYSYFQRHQHDRLDKDGSDDSIPGRGYIAWLLWGGNSGRTWAEGEYKKIQGKKKNPISKPVKKIKEDLTQKHVYLIKVTLDEFRSQAWAQDMVTKEEDFEVVDNYDDNGEPIFKTSEFVYAVYPKKYLQDLIFTRRMINEGKIEKLTFTSACRSWLENDQPLDWFNEQAHDRGYIDSNEYLFLVKVNNPVIEKKENPTKEEEVEATKEYLLELAKECGKRPSRDTPLGIKLVHYLRTDKAFKQKMKELCPDWFIGDYGPREKTKEAMEMFLEMARRGEKRPSDSSKNTEERKLGSQIKTFFDAYPEFEEKIYQANREWTAGGQAEVIRETKNYLIELAREWGTRPPKDTPLGIKLMNYLETDKAFKEKVKELCPDWFASPRGTREEIIAAMEMFLEMARNREKRPSKSSKDPEERKLANALIRFFRMYPDFRKKVLEANRDWFRSEETKKFLSEYKEENPTREEEVQATKEYLLELARGCGKRPQKGTELYNKLRNYLTLDKAFKEKAKELCPDWFIQSSGAREKTKDKMEMFLEMARNGEKKPSTSSKDAEEKKLANELVNLIYRLPEFEEKLYEANRSWTGKGKVEIIKENKEYLIELAKECGARPSIDTDIGANLHDYLYTDIKFKEKIKELCPDWFYQSSGAKEETIAAMEMFLEMARNREKRPSQTSKDPQEKKLGVKLSVLIARYPKFRNQLLITAPEWFRSEERKQFLSEYKEENPLSLIARGFDERPASAYDREELKKGIKTELEHTEDAIIASKIAKDHLDEDPQYYSKLIEMESKMKNPSKSGEDRILKALRFAMIDYAILSALKGAGMMGLPHFAIEQKVNEIVKNDNLRSMTVSIAERLKFYIENSYAFKRSLSPESFKENFPKAGRISDRAYCIDSEGLKLLEKIEELFNSLGHSINDLKDSEKLKASFKQNNPSKDNEMKPEEYFEILGDKMKNPITSSHKKMYLFSYGSNNPQQLAERLERKVKTEGAYAEDTARIFVGHSNLWNGAVASVEAQKGKTVYGLIAEVNEDDLKKMDRYEGVSSRKYKRSKIKVKTKDGKEIEAIVYVSLNTTRGKPSEEYLQAIVKTIGAHWKDSKGTSVSVKDIKTNNPITSSHEKSEEYLPIVEKIVSTASKGTDVWIDEESGDILVGTMAFEEDRSFDDVLIRIKSSGQIKEGESVDDSIRKSAQELMKKIHMALAEYVARKPNPVDGEVDILDEKELLFGNVTYSLLPIAILTILNKKEEKLEFKEIQDELEKIFKIKEISFASIYRDLKRLTAKNLIEEGATISKISIAKTRGRGRAVTCYTITNKGKIALEKSIKELGHIISSLSSEKKSNPASEIDSERLSIIKDFYSKVCKKPNPVPAGVDPEEFDDLVKKLKKRKDVDNPYALANWILKQKNPTSYEKLLKQLQAKGVDDPKALAAWIGRQKYGKEEFQRRAAAGRRKKSNPSSDIKKDFDEILKDKSHD